MLREWILARYSPMMPSENICTPAKIEMIEARNANPGTTAPWIKYLPNT
jgi:N-acetyl-anhydromuramyl-L-alanine amidase AmpD